MYVLRIWLNAGAQIELLYRGKGDVRSAEHTLREAVSGNFIKLQDDFGKDQTLIVNQIAGWQSSDYAAELEGALAIAQAKQMASDKHQREMQKRHSLLVPGLPGNGQIIAG